MSNSENKYDEETWEQLQMLATAGIITTNDTSDTLFYNALLIMCEENLGNRSYKRKRFNRLSFASWISNITEEDFKSHARMSIATFDKLYERVKNHPNIVGKPRYSTTLPPIEPKLKLVITLLYFAGEDPNSLMRDFNIAKSTVLKVVFAVANAICDSLNYYLETPDGKPRLIYDQEFKQSCADAFKDSFIEKDGNDPTLCDIMFGAVGSVDGLVVPVSKPDSSFNAKEYFNRKQTFAIALQGVVDAKGRFIHIVDFTPGSRHDSICWRSGNIGVELDQNNHALGTVKLNGEERKAYIIGDAAYRACPSILTPYWGRNITDKQDVFNFYQSSSRIIVECAFGRLCWKFRRLKMGIPFRDPRKNSIIIRACCLLYNFVFDNERGSLNIEVRTTKARTGDKTMVVSGAIESNITVQLNDTCYAESDTPIVKRLVTADTLMCRKTINELRDKMKTQLWQNGYRRSIHN